MMRMHNRFWWYVSHVRGFLINRYFTIVAESFSSSRLYLNRRCILVLVEPLCSSTISIYTCVKVMFPWPLATRKLWWSTNVIEERLESYISVLTRFATFDASIYTNLILWINSIGLWLSIKLCFDLRVEKLSV